MKPKPNMILSPAITYNFWHVILPKLKKPAWYAIKKNWAIYWEYVLCIVKF